MNQDELIFSSNKDIRKSVDNEVLNFWHLRKKAELDVKYDNSINHKISLHSFRAFFETQASNTHGLEYAHALIGHSGYLEQYYRLSEEDRLEKYIELEPKITIGEDFRNKIKIEKLETEKSELEKIKAKIEEITNSNLKASEFTRDNFTEIVVNQNVVIESLQESLFDLAKKFNTLEKKQKE